MKPETLAEITESDQAAKIEFLGLVFDDLDEAEALNSLQLRAESTGFSYLVTPNVDHVVTLHRKPEQELIEAYGSANLTLCDSRILSMLARWSGLALAPVPGSDLTRRLLETRHHRWRCAVVGGDEALHKNIETIYPETKWLFYAPPMGVRRNAAARLQIAEFVEGASADIILFAIGAPQSEIVCSEIAKRGKARGVALCIGASLEFLTGAKKRAPYWMQRMALEWLYRLASEPARLWRRYLLDGPQIIPIWWQWHRLQATRRRAGSGSSRFAGK